MGIDSTNKLDNITFQTTQLDVPSGLVSFSARTVKPHSGKFAVYNVVNGVSIKAKKIRKADRAAAQELSHEIHGKILEKDPAATDFKIDLGGMVLSYVDKNGQRVMVDLDGSDPRLKELAVSEDLAVRVGELSKRLWGTQTNPYHRGVGKDHALFGTRTQTQVLSTVTIGSFFDKPGKSSGGHLDRLYAGLDENQKEKLPERIGVVASFRHIFHGKVKKLIADLELLRPSSDEKVKSIQFQLKELKRLELQLENAQLFQLLWAGAYLPSLNVTDMGELSQAAYNLYKDQGEVLSKQAATLGVDEVTARHYSIETAGILRPNRVDRYNREQDEGMSPGGPSIERFILAQVMYLEGSGEVRPDFSAIEGHFTADISSKIDESLKATRDEVSAKLVNFRQNPCSVFELKNDSNFSSLFN